MKEPVVQIGDPMLRQHAKPVAKKDLNSPKFKRLIKRMRDVLAKEEFGVAIAAPQVSESLRVFVIAGRAFAKPESSEKSLGGGGQREHFGDKDFSKDSPAQRDVVFINPELVKLSKKRTEMTEGCLSVRDKYGAVMRHERASVRAQDESGRPFTYNGSGLIGHIFQHEVDHLNGILYTDKAVKLEDDKDWEKLGKKRRAGAK